MSAERRLENQAGRLSDDELHDARQRWIHGDRDHLGLTVGAIVGEAIGARAAIRALREAGDAARKPSYTMADMADLVWCIVGGGEPARPGPLGPPAQAVCDALSALYALAEEP